MYKYSLEILPDELYISYLSRLFARYGFIEPARFNKEIFKDSRKTIDLELINPIYDELLTVSTESLIKGSLFTYQYMFIGKKLEKIYQSMLNSDGKVSKVNMGITPTKKKRYLKYCPLCNREESEPYFHTSHQYLNVCLKHRSRLVESSIAIGSKEKTTYKTLIEEDRVDEVEKINIPLEQIRFYEYVKQVVDNEIDFNARGTISSYLFYWMKKREYTTIRQNALRTINLYKESKNKFSEFISFDFPTLSSFKSVLKGYSFNSLTILIIAYTLDITTNDLTHRNKSNKKIHNNVNKIKKLYREGYTQEYIANVFNVTRQFVSKIINDKV